MRDLLAPARACHCLIWGFSLVLLFSSVGYAQSDTTVVREGYLTHTNNGVQVPYYFRIAGDGALTLRRGTDEAEPTVTVPAFVAWASLKQMEMVAPLDLQNVERLGVDLQGKTLWVRWSKQMNVFWVLIIGGLIGGVSMGAGVWLWFRRERTERRRLAESRAHLAAGQEAERSRLAHELHDGPLQDLHGIRMRFGALRQTVPGAATVPAPDRPPHPLHSSSHETEALEEDLVTVIAELRAIMADLHPPALTPFGLGAAIQAHLNRFERRYPYLACRFVNEDSGLDLSPDVRLVLFRVCQEALSNAAKHADASRIKVYLGVEKGRAVLRVSDNGQGFTEAERQAFPERGSFGLSNMAARAEAVGAELRITSALDEGTTIEVVARMTIGERPAERRRRSLAQAAF